MSVEGVTYATAKTLAGVAGMQAAYAATIGAAGDTTVKPIPPGADITLTPVALVTYDHFELQVGSTEIVTHHINADLWFSAANIANIEDVALPILSLCIAAFRNTTAFGAGVNVAKIQRSFPPRTELVAGKDFVIFPLLVHVIELTAQAYQHF